MKNNLDIAKVKKFKNRCGTGGVIIYKKDLKKIEQRPLSTRKYGTFSVNSKEYKWCKKYGHVFDIPTCYPNGTWTTGCSYCGLDCYEYISAPKMYYMKKKYREL